MQLSIHTSTHDSILEQHLLPIYIRCIAGLPLGFTFTFVPLWLHICVFWYFFRLASWRSFPIASQSDAYFHKICIMHFVQHFAVRVVVVASFFELCEIRINSKAAAMLSNHTCINVASLWRFVCWHGNGSGKSAKRLQIKGN